MDNKLINHFRAERWFYLFLTLHFLGWTLLPALIRYNLPLDAIEGTIWGHQLEWGYDKNPFLNGWLTALATFLDGQSGWMVYVFSQLSVIGCFWAVFQLAKNMVPRAFALIAVMILEGIQYYHFHAIDFNDNTLELSLWTLSSYFFYQALTSKKTWSWCLTGFFAAFAMMAKYYTLALLAGMGLFLLCNEENRQQLKTLPPYLGLLVFAVIILPHTIWLFFHDFITVTYVFARASSEPHWTNHLFFPAQFAWQQLEAFLPALFLFLLLFIGKKPYGFKTTERSISAFNKGFLIYVGLGPFLLTLLLSFLLGIKLRAGWGMPLLSLWGILLIALFPPLLTKQTLSRFLATVFILMGTLWGCYGLSLAYSESPSSANFPGQEIAGFITNAWRNQYHSKLDFVAGSRWVGGNIGFYSPDHPAVFIEWDKQRAPWVQLQDLRKKGAVFVWDITNEETMPDSIRQAFPTLSKTIILEFPWKRNTNHLEPIKIGIAFLPPLGKN